MQRSLGSGVIVDATGFIVTNNHVIEGATEIKVSLADKREFEADIVLKDSRTDLAVLRIKDARERFTALEFGNSDELQVGDLVLAIGNPFGVGQTVTHGIVSALARTQVGITDYQFFIQTDAAINPGNSGGALVDMTGKLVGINTAIFSRSGGSQGIGFAIPANMVQVVAASAKSGGSAVKRPWLGARLQNVTPEIAESLGHQARIRRAGCGHHAEFAGRACRPEDRRSDRLHRRPGGRRPERLRLPLRHQAAWRQRATRRPAQWPRDDGQCRAADGARHPARGTRDSRAARPSPARRSAICRRRWPTNCGSIRRPRALSILDIANGSPAQRLGFQRGDVIVAVNDQKVARTRDLDQATQRAGAGLAHHHQARRPADHGEFRRMTPRAQRGGANLFTAAGLEQDAPRPLADKLRPQKLSEVVGQDHLLGPDGALTRMLATRSLGSLMFWGPPGTGKTTVARLLGARDRPAFRADFRDLFRRRRPEEGIRAGARAPRKRAGHSAVRRRDPPLQPRAAGFISAGDGGRHHRAGRRHHRESVL